MTTTDQKIEDLRRRIPSFMCIVGCHDCCGPVLASPEEVARLPAKTNQEHEVALVDYNCVYLGVHGCQVYNERPLICRLFGTTPRLPCPNGKRPVYMVDSRTEQEIDLFLANRRKVLL